MTNETFFFEVAIDADPCITGANMAVCIKSKGEKVKGNLLNSSFY